MSFAAEHNNSISIAGFFGLVYIDCHRTYTCVAQYHTVNINRTRKRKNEKNVNDNS